MSLINKMLQDLEQRNDSADKHQPLAGEVRAVPAASAPRTGMLVGVLLLVVVLLGVGWMLMQPKAPAPVIVAAAPAMPAAVPAPVVAPAPVAAAPAAPVAPAPAVAVPAAPPVAAAPAVAVAPAAKPHQTTAPAKPAAEPKAKQPAVVLADASTTGGPAISKKPSKVVRVEAASAPSSAAVKTASVAVPAAEGRWQKKFSPQQQSDNLYKQAITQLQQGQGAEAKKSLRLALEASPGNAKARQVLVDLLVEAGSVEEALALLREGLRLSPEQTGLSMALARLQLDSGDTQAAMTTLEQGLKSAGDEPQYHAFYAVLLQRAKRHDEAVQHYLVALRSDPMMPTWLVGIGISLQAQGKNSDAAEAFQRARDGGMLTPQLAQFVEQRLSQLK